MKKTNSKPSWISAADNDIQDALETIYSFIHQITGQAPTQTELAAALKRYFVLNEIKDHIVMERSKDH